MSILSPMVHDQALHWNQGLAWKDIFLTRITFSVFSLLAGGEMEEPVTQITNVRDVREGIS